MNFADGLFGSSLGRKFVMAASGALLFLFVIGHLLGNLQIFLGPEAINRYAHFLQSNVEILWPVRIGLLVLVILHLWSAARLTRENRAARPVGYAGEPTPPAASYASRTMLMSGLIIAAFVIYHLLHFTVRVKAINLTGTDFVGLHDAKGRHDVYAMMVLGFRQPLVSGFYVLAMALLCLHLSHGAYAMFQSLGITIPCCPDLPKRFARWAAILIFVGYVSIPVAVLAGLGRDYVQRT
ncbi:MAG: succinate dehydrogenase cytochrome b subunit, partial [Verrucomicrobiae bacterium]|nr:succinate dehydrogenase cytochrome b subunit [Verrucomicrobiae bacterium]